MRALEPVQGRIEMNASAARRALAWCGVRRWALAVWGGMALWSAVLFAIVRSDYLGFRLSRFDLGNMVQAVWSTAHGRPLEMTSPATGEQVARLAFHVDPILVLLTPLWLLVPSPLTLAGAQIVVCALGALPVFWLGRRHLGSERAAALLALAYLAYPWLAWSAVDPIHPVTLAIPLFLFAIWFLDSDRLWAFAVVAVLIAATGELMGLSIAALGIWYAIARGHRRAGAAIALLGAGWSIVAVKVIVPAFLDTQSIYYAQYDSVGGSPGGIVRTLFTDPAAIVSKLFSTDNVVYWVWLAVPLLGLFVLAPWISAVALPELLVNGLSDRPTMSDPRFHYVAGLLPFLVAGVVLGLARLSPVHRTRAAAAVLGVSAVTLFAFGPIPGGPTRGSHAAVIPARHVDALRAAVALVPDRAPVTSTNAVGATLSARRYAYSVPMLGRSEWAVLDMRNAWMWDGRQGGATYPERLAAFRVRLARSPSWTKVFDEDDVLVFRRVPEGEGSG